MDVYEINCKKFKNYWFKADENAENRKHLILGRKGSDPSDTSTMFKSTFIKTDGVANVYAFESLKFPGHYLVDPGVNDASNFVL